MHTEFVRDAAPSTAENRGVKTFAVLCDWVSLLEMESGYRIAISTTETA